MPSRAAAPSAACTPRAARLVGAEEIKVTRTVHTQQCAALARHRRRGNARRVGQEHAHLAKVAALRHFS
eukprot:4096897-Prymnesium_polylepis.1